MLCKAVVHPRAAFRDAPRPGYARHGGQSLVSCKAGQRHHPVRIRRPRLTELLSGVGRSEPSFDVALPPPDLSAWLCPSSGVPGVWVLDSGQPGPEVVVSALVHGNEYAGGWALETVRRRNPLPKTGRLTLILANIEAFSRFNADLPVDSRYVDEDFNRLWHHDRLNGSETSRELDRARQIQPFVERADILLDLHSTLWPSAPLFIVPPRERSAHLASALAGGDGMPRTVLTDLGHFGGSRMIEHAHFLSHGGTGRSCLLEAGPHWHSDTVGVMERVIDRLLESAEAVHLVGQSPFSIAEAEMAVVTDNVIARTDDFRFVQPWHGGTIIPEAGTLLAHDGQDMIYAPYDDCILIMPNLAPRRGQLAVRLARRTASGLRP